MYRSPGFNGTKLSDAKHKFQSQKSPTIIVGVSKAKQRFSYDSKTHNMSRRKRQAVKQTGIENHLRSSVVDGVTVLHVLLFPLVIDFESTMKLFSACFQQRNIYQQQAPASHGFSFTVNSISDCLE